MNIYRLVVISLISRCVIGFCGLLQYRSALPIFEINGLAQIAGATTFLSAGILFESGLAWNLRMKISQASGEEIWILAREACRRILTFCLPLYLLCFIILICARNSFVQLIFLILSLTLINLLFLPWLRLLEGVGEQHITMLIQTTISIFLLLFTLLRIDSMNILQFVLVSNCGTLLSSIFAYIYCRLKFRRLVVQGASHHDEFPNKVILHRESFIVVSSGTIMFSFFPTIYHWSNDDNFVAQSGIQLRIFSLMIGVIGVIGTHLQIMGRSKVETKKLSLKTEIYVSLSLILVFSLSDKLLQYLVLGEGNKFNLIESLAYGVLASLVASQIGSSAEEMKKFGLNLQARSYLACVIFFLIGCGASQFFNFSLVWYTCAIYFFLHVRPLRTRAHR